MPRQPRRKSESGIYHVMLRGINKQPIFSSDADKSYFLKVLEKYRERCGFTLYGYCLMSNHVHLLLKETENFPLGAIMKRIAGSYVYWYNLCYQRVGHLFQDRFRSEPVDDDSYFLTVLRYIHQNPVKAGMHRRIGDYKWSSYADYKSESVEPVDTRLAIDIAGYSGLMEFMAEYNEDECLDDRETVVPMTPQQTERMFAELAGVALEDFADLPMSRQKDVVQKSVAAGMTERRVAELSGWSRYAVRKAR